MRLKLQCLSKKFFIVQFWSYSSSKSDTAYAYSSGGRQSFIKGNVPEGHLNTQL